MNRADRADASYWEGLAAGRLLLPRCGQCHRWIWPAGRRCGACGTIGMHWIERPMKARVYSWTRTWHRFGLTEGLDLPFTTIVAEVEDCAVRLLGRLHDPERIDPVIGEPLTGRPAETIVGDDRIPTILWSRSA